MSLRNNNILVVDAQYIYTKQILVESINASLTFKSWVRLWLESALPSNVGFFHVNSNLIGIQYRCWTLGRKPKKRINFDRYHFCITSKQIASI